MVKKDVTFSKGEKVAIFCDCKETVGTLNKDCRCSILAQKKSRKPKVVELDSSVVDIVIRKQKGN